jgi:hypothetical protein
VARATVLVAVDGTNRFHVSTTVLEDTEHGPELCLGSLGSGAGNIDNVVHLTIVYDDGSLQRRLDEQYGEGVVDVSSALQPVD